MAHDPTRGRTVMFSGSVNDPCCESGYGSGLWLYENGGWRPLTSVGGPIAGADHTMVFDPARDEFVLTGGGDCCNTFIGTWTLDPDSFV